MGNCYLMGSMLVLLLGSFCIWNCYHRQNPSSEAEWHGCRDQDGQQVDSFIMYKLPMNQSSQYSLIQEGLGYMYLTPDTTNSLKQSGGVSSLLSYTDTAAGWLLSNRSIADSRSMPALTLDLLYSQTQWMRENAVYFFYNDEFPNGTTSVEYGHTKGVVMMTEHGGFWLVHSVPRYPPAPPQDHQHSLNSAPQSLKPDYVIINNSAHGSDALKDEYYTNFSNKNSELPFMRNEQNENSRSNSHSSGSYDYPETGKRYGQSFICMSLPPEQADNLGWQLLQNHPYIYSWHVATRLQGRFPVLERVAARRPPPSATSQFRVTQLATQQGNTFTSFAKCTNYSKDLYSGLVAPSLKTSLLVESWRNGPHPLPSDCNANQYRVKNIEALSVRVSSSSFTTHHDHSKWAVSADGSKPYVCIGDINRMASQLHRAGGTVCVWSQTVWNRFYRLVTKVEACSRGGVMV